MVPFVLLAFCSQYQANLCGEASLGLVAFSHVVTVLWFFPGLGTWNPEFTARPVRPQQWPWLDPHNPMFERENGQV